MLIEPDNLTFGICWQHNQDDEFDQEIYEYMKDDRFQVIDVHPKQERARYMLGKTYNSTFIL